MEEIIEPHNTEQIAESAPVRSLVDGPPPEQTFDPYNLEHYRSPRANELLKLVQPYKKFEQTDMYMIAGVFLIGFVFALVLSNYYKAKNQKINQINAQFQGLKGEYELVQKRLGRYIQWKYRVKLAEKIYYILLLSLAFLFYKSPSLLSYTFTEIPQYSIPFFTLSIISFHLVSLYLDKKEKDQEKRHKKLKDQLKDTKRLLISHMDPIMIQTVKEIVRKDMRREIEQMKNSDQGCSVKCKLINEMLKKDLGRNKVIVNEFIQFKWCDTCQNAQPGAVQVCHAGCGQKVFKRCLPLMKDYGEMDQDISKMKAEIADITNASLKFSEFQKAKKELEYEESKKMSQTYSMLNTGSNLNEKSSAPAGRTSGRL
ncbi:UNKNOWN [Stylonychia lemnae]|uniref:Transmembrane protein n=1 Tax=Stylonychia lemnae TaxID=5949 RepID=A0A078AW07_STYLE|nr:UNKNOWN [Stylonychia lemnae]|eukprot:CDW86271.1 UNKNOWN [Stylonychia lemnae]